MFTLEMQLLTGVYRAASVTGGVEWPPHPDRLYSALVQSWADGGKLAAERAALEWLEAVDPPELEASEPARGRLRGLPRFGRSAPIVYVPPNDPSGKSLDALPGRRRRQPRRFEAITPDSDCVRFRWAAVPPAEIATALRELARRVSSVGHSASLVRLDCVDTEVDCVPCRSLLVPDARGSENLRVPHAGRLDDLEHWHRASTTSDRVQRPRVLRTERYAWQRGDGEGRPGRSQPLASQFGGEDDWYVFHETWPGPGSHPGRPDLLAFPHVARRVRDALMGVTPDPPPEVISGHGPDGGPSRRPHVAVIPLAQVGHRHASGELAGFALILPRELSDGDRQAVLGALVALVRREGEASILTLRLSRHSEWTLSHVSEPEPWSLRPWRWCRPSREWASVTPVLLDRFPRKGDPLDQARCIEQACVNVGLPAPSSIELSPHSFVRAAPSAAVGRTRDHQPDWSFPRDSSIAHRFRRHVRLEFEREVQGPVLLGAGRYQGMGACLPIDRMEGRHGA